MLATKPTILNQMVSLKMQNNIFLGQATCNIPPYIDQLTVWTNWNVIFAKAQTKPDACM